MEKRFPADPITVAPLAWKPDFSFDRQSFADLVDYLKGLDTFAIYFGCTAGEGYALSREMLVDITKFFAQRMEGYDRPYFVSLIGLSLAEMIERVGLVKGLGIKNIMFALPSWAALRPDEVDPFVNTLMAAHRDCNFILYNNYRSVTRLYGKDLLRLAKQNPNFVAVKQGGHAYVDARCCAVLDEPLPLVEYYLDFAWTYANLFFTPSFMPSTLSCSFKTAIDFYRAGLSKDFARCIEIDREVQRADELMASIFTGDRVDGAYDKLWLKLCLPDFPLRLYPPYQAFGDELFERYAAGMKALLPHWFD